MHQTSRNKGEEFLVPEYTLFDIGTFLLVKKSFGKFDLSGGLRYDSRIENGKDLYLKFPGRYADWPGTRFNSSIFSFSYELFRPFRQPGINLADIKGALYQTKCLTRIQGTEHC